MGLRFTAQKSSHCFFVTTTFADFRPYGRTPGMYEALARCLAFCADKYSAKIAGYVFMPTHLHVVVFLDGGRLGAFMRDFKKFIAQKAARDLAIKTEHLWMPRFDRLAIESEAILRSRLTYLHNNPVKAGLAPQPGAWEWSSALDYESERARLVTVWKGWA